jgi:hypothetical protein
MSCLIAKRSHIDLLVALAGLYNLLDGRTKSEFGKMLMQENDRSWSSQDKQSTAFPYRFKTPDSEQVRNMPPIALVKQVQFFIYQCADTDDYKTTPAVMAMEQLRIKLSEKHGIPLDSRAVENYPGWREAPWGID